MSDNETKLTGVQAYTMKVIIFFSYPSFRIRKFSGESIIYIYTLYSVNLGIAYVRVQFLG